MLRRFLRVGTNVQSWTPRKSICPELLTILPPCHQARRQRSGCRLGLGFLPGCRHYPADEQTFLRDHGH
jgi:hypothetical protein